MRSLFTPIFATLALALTAVPVHAAAVAPTDPTGSFYDLFFDGFDTGFPTGDNFHEALDTQFLPGDPLNTTDLLYTSSFEGDGGFSLILDESFTPDAATGGGVMHFKIDNRDNPGQPMFPGVGTSVDEAILDIIFQDFSAPVLGVAYTVTYTASAAAGSDAIPATINGNAPIDLSLAWLASSELVGAKSIQVDVTIGAAAVPEPTSLVLVGGVITALFGLRRRLA